MTKLDTIKRLCEKWDESGRCSFIYPRKRVVSLNGMKPVPFDVAIKKIKECIE